MLIIGSLVLLLADVVTVNQLSGNLEVAGYGPETLCEFAASAKPDTINAATNKSLRMIQDAVISRACLLEAISTLGDAGEPASFWVAIANDSKYSAEHRGCCVRELFRRHVRPGMTVAELSKVLNGSKWLDDGMIYRFMVLAGYVPVASGLSDLVFCIHLVPNSAESSGVVYLSIEGAYPSIEGALETSQLRDAMRGTRINEKIGRHKIVDVWPRK